MDRKFSRSTGKVNLVPQYYYVSNSNKDVNTKEDYMTLLQWFLLIEQEVNLQLVEPAFDFNSSKCCCKVQRTCKQGSWHWYSRYKVFISWQLTVILMKCWRRYTILSPRNVNKQLFS